VNTLTSPSIKDDSSDIRTHADTTAFDQLTCELFGDQHLKDSVGLRQMLYMVPVVQAQVVPLIMACRKDSARLSRGSQFFIVHFIREITYCYMKCLPDDISLGKLIDRARSYLGEAAVAGQPCILCKHPIVESLNDSWTDSRCKSCNVPYEVKTTLRTGNGTFCVGNHQGDDAFKTSKGHFVIFTPDGVKISNNWVTSTIQKNGKSHLVARLINPKLISLPFVLTPPEITLCSKLLGGYYKQLISLSLVFCDFPVISENDFKYVFENAVKEFNTINKIPANPELWRHCEQSQSPEHTPSEKQKRCVHFERGSCKFGSRCHYLHE
jgi:hypothetical protein